MIVTENDREWLVKMHTQGRAGATNAPFSGRFRPQKRKSRRAVPGIKPGPALQLDDSIAVWLDEDRYRRFMNERGRRLPTVEEQVKFVDWYLARVTKGSFVRTDVEGEFDNE